MPKRKNNSLSGFSSFIPLQIIQEDDGTENVSSMPSEPTSSQSEAQTQIGSEDVDGGSSGIVYRPPEICSKSKPIPASGSNQETDPSTLETLPKKHDQQPNKSSKPRKSSINPKKVNGKQSPTMSTSKTKNSTVKCGRKRKSLGEGLSGETPLVFSPENYDNWALPSDLIKFDSSGNVDCPTKVGITDKVGIIDDIGTADQVSNNNENVVTRDTDINENVSDGKGSVKTKNPKNKVSVKEKSLRSAKSIDSVVDLPTATTDLPSASKPLSAVIKHARFKRELDTDLTKSFAANVEDRLKHWEQIKNEIEYLTSKLSVLEKNYAQIVPSDPKNRPLLARCRAEIQHVKIKINKLKQASDPTEYLYCVAHVIRETEDPIVSTKNETIIDQTTLSLSTLKGEETTHSVVNAVSTDNQTGAVVTQQFSQPMSRLQHLQTLSEDKVRVNASGPLKQKVKKKKLPHQIHNEAHSFNVKPITSYELFSGMMTERVDSAKKLAQYLHEIPIDTSEIEYCPTCIVTIMDINERPPSLYCAKCGLTIEIMDNTSAAVHDKETTTHLPFTYRPKLHFISWIRRITGKLKFSIPPEITDDVIFKLYQRGITDVNLVTWEIVDDIIRTLAKSDKKYADFYPHVYQITNIIRSKPILVFTDEEEQEIIEYFDPIYMLWESKKHLFNTDRSNFMYNALVLQIIFMILKYPVEVIRMFNMIKGDNNRGFYNDVIKMICKELEEKPFTTSDLEIMKYGTIREDVLEGLSKANLGNLFEMYENEFDSSQPDKVATGFAYTNPPDITTGNSFTSDNNLPVLTREEDFELV